MPSSASDTNRKRGSATAMCRGRLGAGVGAVVLLCPGEGNGLAQGGATILYTCTAEPPRATQVLGLTLCDAEPTAELSARAASDNLQQREGALVLDLEANGLSDEAGLHAGDVIYRVGGVDVAGAEAAAESLAEVQSRADTVVNFLRRGRPYRVKLRRE